MESSTNRIATSWAPGMRRRMNTTLMRQHKGRHAKISI